MFCHILYKSSRNSEIGISSSRAVLSSLTSNIGRKMFKLIAVLIAASALVSIIKADPLADLKATIKGEIQGITNDQQAILKAQQGVDDAAIAAAAKGKDPSKCAAEVKALAVTKQSQIDGVNGICSAKLAVLDTTVGQGPLDTFRTTEPGYKAQLVALIVTYKDSYHNPAVGVIACFNGA